MMFPVLSGVVIAFQWQENLASNKNVVGSLLYLISEPEQLCILNISLSQVGQNIS